MPDAVLAGSVRERRRAQTIQEIKEAALRQLDEGGAGSLSLRAVGRAVGMTVQSLYHYFDGRDALLTELVVDSHNALADAVQAAADGTRGQAPAVRLHAACQAYRNWADQHRTEFLLLYGTPVPGFRSPVGGQVSAAGRRLADPFLDAVFDGWTPEELASVPLQPGAEPIAALPPALSLPPGALALFIEFRGRLHGLIMLELLGHAHPLNAHAGALFRGAVSRMSAELAALRTQQPPSLITTV